MISGADLTGAMLGMLFVTLGLAASGAAAIRSVRHDRTLLWFGVFTLLYGLRLISRSDVVQLVVPLTIWHTAEDVITYVILVAGALVASAALGGVLRGFLRYVWMVDSVAVHRDSGGTPGSASTATRASARTCSSGTRSSSSPA